METLSCQILVISRFTKSLLSPYHNEKKVDKGTASRSLYCIGSNKLLAFQQGERVRGLGLIGQGCRETFEPSPLRAHHVQTAARFPLPPPAWFSVG